MVLQPFEPAATFEALDTVQAGVLPGSAFRLAMRDGSDPVANARYLVAEPPVAVDVSRDGPAAIVTPRTPLVPGANYRFTLSDAAGTVQGTWAVQAVGPLAVVASIPDDEVTDVPVDSGIEFTFNQAGVAAADVERFLDVEPAVAGRVEVAGRSAAFVPDAPLARNTLYAVTLRRGLPLAGTAMTLEQDIVLAFETRGADRSSLTIRAPRRLVSTAPDEPALISLTVESDADEWRVPPDLGLTVHRLRGMDAAVEAYRTLDAQPYWARGGAAPIDVDGLALVLDDRAEIGPLEPDNDYQQVARLPVGLPTGWFLATLRGEDSAVQVVLQVTDLAVFAEVTTTRSIAWVNRVASGRPGGDVAVTLAGTSLGRTDSEGIVSGPTPRAATSDRAGVDAPILVARAADASAFLPVGERLCVKCGHDEAAEPWWLVFRPDRDQLRSSDTVTTWGVLRERRSGNPPDEVTVSLAAAWDDAAPPIATTTAVPDRNGVFAAGITFDELPYGEYVLSLEVDGVVLADRWVGVSRILKPAWRLGVTASRGAVIDGSTVGITADATFFEGTPVVGAELVTRGTSDNVTLVTGADGTATGSVRLRARGGGQWTIADVWCRPRLPEEGEITGSTQVAVFKAGVVVRSEAVVRGGRLRVDGSVHDVAFGRFDGATGWLGDIDPYGRARAGVPLQVRIVEHWWEPRQTGTEYDWIEKRAVPVYDYDHRRQVVLDAGRRSDDDGEFALAVDARVDRSYEVRVTATDEADRDTTEETWAATDSDPWASDIARIAIVGSEEDESEGFGIGETVEARFLGVPAQDDARYLWTTAASGLTSWRLTSVPRWSAAFRADDVPGFRLSAVQFANGRYALADIQPYVPFRAADRQLTVTIEPDRPRYAPGDPVTLAIHTRDAEGRSVPASLYLGVIDEKLVAMGVVDETDPLWPLYMAVGSGVLSQGGTHKDPRDDAGGSEGGDTTGGGGSEAVRTDFRDWLVARLVRTDDDGRARVAFDLSDDLTSWHVAAAGVSRRLDAGRGEASIPVSLPFFAEVTLADSYLAADRPIVRLRAYGGGLAAGETVTYRVSSDTLPMEPVAVTAAAFEAAELPLPALTAGRHTLRVAASTRSGDDRRSDVLERTFQVVDHRAAQASVTYAALERATTIPAGAGLTTLVLSDAGRGRVVPVLQQLAAADAVRGDRALAAVVAARALREAFGIEDAVAGQGVDLAAFDVGDGYALLPYASSHLELTALAALAGEPQLADIESAFDWAEPTTREERIWVLAGRAASGDPVHGEVRELAELADLTVDEQVALAIAALATGDEPLAARLERDVLRDHGERYGPWVRVVAANRPDETAVLTARLAIVAASLGDDVAGAMDAFVEANPPRTTVVDLERALAASRWARRLPPADASATLTVGGTDRVVRIEASRPQAIVLTPAQARGAILAPLEGSVLVTTRSDVPIDPASLERPAWLVPVRTVTPTGDVGAGDTVVVRLVMDSPVGTGEDCWAVTDFVPSGLVPVTEAGWSRWGARPWRIEGQRVDFCLEPRRDGRTQEFVYAARVITPGTYRWEPAVVQSALDPGHGAVIPATTLTIRGER